MDNRDVFISVLEWLRAGALESGLAASRKALENTTEEHLKTWRLKMDSQVLSEGPRYFTISNER
jgi:hypothetical protein